MSHFLYWRKTTMISPARCRPCVFGILLLPAFVFAGPRTAPRNPWFTTDPNLLRKEALIEKRTLQHVTPEGLLLYTALFPWTNLEKFQSSHDVADLPAWQGYLMAAYAFKEAVTKVDQDEKIRLLADGLLTIYKITGIQGLLARSAFPGYKGRRLSWMNTEQGSPTKFWIQGPTGEWFRNGLAKDHINLAAFGAAIPLALDRQGAITLHPSTRQKLLDLLLPLVNRLAANNYQIIDWNGKPTEFGNLGPQIANGFNQMIVLHMLVSAQFYDPKLANVYRREIKAWHKTIGWSLQALGQFTRRFIGDKRGTDFDKPSFSDMQALGLAYLSIALQESRREYMKSIHRGMEGVWKFMRYERNPMYSIPYVATIRPVERFRIEAIIEDLRDFPIEKYAAATGQDETHYIQPLANRPLNSNYWKSSPWRTIKNSPPPTTGEELAYAGMDYLLAYWMGRYFNLVPAE